MANRFNPERKSRLDAPERAAWQKPDDVVAALGLPPGSLVVEIGAGSGYFTSRLSPAVGREGRVIAVDIQKNMLDGLRERCRQEGIANVEFVEAPGESTGLAPSIADAVFLANVTHEYDDLTAGLGEAARLLRPGGALAVVDWDARETGVGPPLDHRLERGKLEDAAGAAGLRPGVCHDFLPHQYFVVFCKGD